MVTWTMLDNVNVSVVCEWGDGIEDDCGSPCEYLVLFGNSRYGVRPFSVCSEHVDDVSIADRQLAQELFDQFDWMDEDAKAIFQELLDAYPRPVPVKGE